MAKKDHSAKTYNTFVKEGSPQEINIDSSLRGKFKESDLSGAPWDAATTEVLKLFKQLRSGGQTFVIVTHDELVAAGGRYADLWKGYRPYSQIEAASKTDQERMTDLVDLQPLGIVIKKMKMTSWVFPVP